jgi:hypothetical protein
MDVRRSHETPLQGRFPEFVSLDFGAFELHALAGL